MVRTENIDGIPVVIEARPVGGLGWTWAFYPERGPGGSNARALASTESEAFAVALAEARRVLGQRDAGT